MTERPDFEFDEERRKHYASAIKKHLHANGLSRKSLIRNDLSESTIDKALAGTKLSQATVDKIEAILKTKFDLASKTQAPETPKIPSEKSSESLGNYTFSAVEHLQGDYLFVRPTFKNPSIISAYLIAVRWDEGENCLAFSERSRSDTKYTQSGKVYVPFGRPFLNFLTGSTGGVRLVVVSMPDSDHIMRGIITTLHNPSGPSFIPISAPAAMLKVKDATEDMLGQITSESPHYLSYKKLLDEVVADQYGMMVSGVEFVDRRRGLTVIGN